MPTIFRLPVRTVMVRAQCECGGEIKAVQGYDLRRRNEKAEWESICHGKCGQTSKQDRAYPYVDYELIDHADPFYEARQEQEQANVSGNSIP